MMVHNASVLTSPRRNLLLGRLQRDGQIVAKALSQELGLSEDTIRRDLRELAAEGKLQRVHGGALPASPAVTDFAGRQQIGASGKAAIGRAAAAMVQPGQVVLLDGGTTAVQVARQFRPDLSATVITHSPTIAVELVAHPRIEVVLLGGRLFKHSVVTVGAAVIEAAGQIRADTFFMGVTGIHPEAGLSTGDLEEAHVKRALSQRAAETIVLASSEKLYAASAYVIAPLNGVSGMIVETSVPENLLAPFRQAGLNVTVA